MNIVVQMSTAANTAHQGIWMENGRCSIISLVKLIWKLIFVAAVALWVTWSLTEVIPQQPYL